MARKAKQSAEAPEEGAPENGTSDKVQGKAMYSGNLILKSVDGLTHKDISHPISLGPPDVGEEYAFYCLQQSYPHALREYFEVEVLDEPEPEEPVAEPK